MIAPRTLPPKIAFTGVTRGEYGDLWRQSPRGDHPAAALCGRRGLRVCPWSGGGAGPGRAAPSTGLAEPDVDRPDPGGRLVRGQHRQPDFVAGAYVQCCPADRRPGAYAGVGRRLRGRGQAGGLGTGRDGEYGGRVPVARRRRDDPGRGDVAARRSPRPALMTAGALRRIGLGAAIGSLLALPVAVEVRVRRARQPLTDAWRTTPIEPRGATRLGVSFRPPQIATLGLELESTFEKLVAYPFQLIRLGAYWNRIEPASGVFDTRALDWQVHMAVRDGKQVVLCVGPLKTFGYPELFVPGHRLQRALPEHTLIKPVEYASLLDAATEFATRIVERYKRHASVVAWQV